MKKNLTYMLAVTSDYIFAAGNIVLSLIKQRPQKDFDITIFYDEILPQDKKILEDTGICHLIQYHCPAEFEQIIRRDCPKFNNKDFAKHFSFLKFAKFEIFDLLKKYHNAIWLDVDIAIQDDPSDMLRYGPFAISKDENFTVRNNFTHPIAGYDMNKPGVCSAVFLISDQLPRWQEMKQWCYDTAAKVCPYFKNIDQGIWNLLLQHFNIQHKLLELPIYQCHPEKEGAHLSKIVHFGTPNRKIWSQANVVSAFPEWYRIHKKWLSLGGSDYPVPEDYRVMNVFNLMQLLEKLQRRDVLIKILGIPLFKRKCTPNKKKYYCLGIRFLTIKTLGK